MGNCNSCGSSCSSSSSLCSSCESSCQSSCDSVSQCCDSVVPSCPTPFYAQPSVCLESHAKTYVMASYAAAVKVSNSFNIPACSASAEVKIPGLKAITIGSYMWNPLYGYLQVLAFDLSREMVTVQNNCNTGNAAPGTVVPACTLFAVTDAPTVPGGGSSPTGIFVAIDFTAPNVGTCLLITVTGVTGLAVNKLVGIGSGTYRINSIPDATHIEICNDGDGITPGSAVIAKDGAGNYQYPLVAIDTNPCTNAFITEGAVLACNAGNASPLTGSQAGMVLVLQDPETGVAEYVWLDVPTRTCATIGCCLTIVAGFAGPYVVSVSDSSQFNVGNYLQIGTRTDRFIVSSIPDGTTLVGNLSAVPGATVDIPPGTSICLIDCCEDLQGQINQIEIDITNIEGDVTAIDNRVTALENNRQASSVSGQSDDNAGGTVDGTPYLSPLMADIVITNNNPVSNMLFNLSFLARAYGEMDDSPGAIEFKLGYDILFTGPGAPPDIIRSGGSGYGQRIGWQESVAPGVARGNDWYMNIPQVVVLPPGVTMTITNVTIEISRSSGTPTYVWTQTSREVFGIGVSQ